MGDCGGEAEVHKPSHFGSSLLSRVQLRVAAGGHQQPNKHERRHHELDKMSRQSMAPNRNLSLTEELEKLEQSITLTLQGKQTSSLPHQLN